MTERISGRSVSGAGGMLDNGLGSDPPIIGAEHDNEGDTGLPCPARLFERPT